VDTKVSSVFRPREASEEQNIPRKIPTSKKDEEKTGRLKNFEKRHGIGTVELNTLTDPTRADYFERLLRYAIAALRDPDLYRRAREAREHSETMVAEEFDKQMRWPQRALDLIDEQADENGAAFEEERAEIQRLEDELRRLKNDLDTKIGEELAPLRERTERVRPHTIVWGVWRN
jgi:hypothetical protein